MKTGVLNKLSGDQMEKNWPGEFKGLLKTSMQSCLTVGCLPYTGKTGPSVRVVYTEGITPLHYPHQCHHSLIILKCRSVLIFNLRIVSLQITKW